MFTLYKADESWTKGEEVEVVTSKNGGTFGFEKLLPGNYLLNETKAATGYSLVTEPWKIVIKNNGEVTVTKNDGEPVIAKNSDKRYMIENAKVYSLPESGGPGTYGFTISGVAILATAQTSGEGTQSSDEGCEGGSENREEGYRNHQSDASDACSLCCDRNCDRGDPGCRYQFCSEQKTTQEMIYG